MLSENEENHLSIVIFNDDTDFSQCERFFYVECGN